LIRISRGLLAAQFSCRDGHESRSGGFGDLCRSETCSWSGTKKAEVDTLGGNFSILVPSTQYLLLVAVDATCAAISGFEPILV